MQSQLSLSEAILLGSTMIKPKRGTMYEITPKGERGCAMGMAYKALGLLQNESWRTADETTLLLPLLTAPAQFPCNCTRAYPGELATVIAHLFDFHVVLDGRPPLVLLEGQVLSATDPWTLEQLVDWVRTQEAKIQPTEEAKDADRVTDNAQCSH